MKRYMYHDNNVVAAGEPIRLETSDTFFYFCYHPERKEYIRIKSPMRLETDPSVSQQYPVAIGLEGEVSQ